MLVHLVALETLDMRWTNVADLRPIGTLTKLTRLMLIANRVATVFAFLAHLVALEELELTQADGHFTSVAMCAGLRRLRSLRVDHSVDMVRSLMALPHANEMDVAFPNGLQCVF